MKKIEEFYVIEYNGGFWGVLYEDGRETNYGYGSIDNARRIDPRYCKKPEDATYRGSYLVKHLQKGRIVKVRKETAVTILT